MKGKRREPSQENRKVFQKRLRDVRESRGLSQIDLARKADLQPPAICQFEKGVQAPSFENLRRLVDALNVPVDYLMGRSELEVIVAVAKGNSLGKAPVTETEVSPCQ